MKEFMGKNVYTCKKCIIEEEFESVCCLIYFLLELMLCHILALP